MAEEEKWFEDYLKKSDEKIFAIDTEEGGHVGNIGLHSIDFKNRKATLGIVIGEKKYWNQGYGTDAIRALLKFAFRELNLNKVILDVLDNNKRAIRVYEKCGFTREGTRREEVFKDGSYRDIIRMSILSREFEAFERKSLTE